MKRLWIAVAILVFLLAASLVNAWYANNLTKTISGRLEQAQLLAEAGNWEEAESLTRKAYDNWERDHVYVYTFLQHTDADQILLGFRSVLQYVKLQEMDQYAAANADLVTQLDLLAEKEQPSLLNVL